MISTCETTRQIFLLDKLLRKNNMVLVVGPSGCGKTNLIRNYLANHLSKEEFEINHIHFSAHTSANQTQDSILNKMIKLVDYFAFSTSISSNLLFLQIKKK